MRRQKARRRWPTAESLLAARLRHASKGAGQRAVITGLVACIGDRVEPTAPALNHWSRERWEEMRRTELLRQVDVIRARPEGPADSRAVGEG